MQRDILEQLYKKYHHTAYIYTLSLCKDSYLAEDIVNDAFVKAFLSFADDKTNFKCWLLVVCRNLFYDFARKKKKISDKDIYEFNDILKTDSFENVIITSERNQILYNCIILLPEKYKEILILHYFSGLSLVEISQILKLSPGNIKTTIFRARVKLKNILEEKGYEF